MSKITSTQALSELDQVNSIDELVTLVRKISGNVFNPDGTESQQIRLLYSGKINGDIHTGDIVYDLIKMEPEKYTEIGKSEVAKFLGKQEFVDKLDELTNGDKALASRILSGVPANGDIPCVLE